MKEKYIKLDDIINILNKYIEAREKKSNCSKGALIELNIFKLVKTIIERINTYEF